MIATRGLDKLLRQRMARVASTAAQMLVDNPDLSVDDALISARFVEDLISGPWPPPAKAPLGIVRWIS